MQELADAMRGLLAVRPGARVFKYGWEGDLYNLTSKRLNDYVKLYLGEEFTAKDFRTWGGTLIAAIALRRARARGSRDEVRRRSATSRAVMRHVAEQLGNTPAVCRASYVAPAVVEQYLEGQNDRGFPTAPFARRQRARSRSLSGGSGDCSACSARGVFVERAKAA